jgi:hypothetical protein
MNLFNSSSILSSIFIGGKANSLLGVYIKNLMMKVFEELSFHFNHSHPHHHLNMLPKVNLEVDLILQAFFL